MPQISPRNELAGADHQSSAMFTFGGDTESSTTLRMPSGWSRKYASASRDP